MDTRHQALVVLSRALDQAGDALAAIHRDDWDRPTPCTDWSVRDLAAHLAAAPEHFLQQARGQDVDWEAPADVGDGAWAAYFRVRADDLIHHWHGRPDEQAPQADWQSAEIGVHTWDLVTALGRAFPLDDEVAERGLAFLQQNLTDERRRPAFRSAIEVPADAGAYERLVAFAGRRPR